MKNFIFPLLCACTTWLSAQQKTITLEDIWTKNTFAAERIDAIRSANDGEHYFVLENRQIIAKYQLTTGEKTSELLNLSQFSDYKETVIDGYQMSADEKKVLITTKSNPIYRRSFEAEFVCFDLETQIGTPVSVNGKQRLSTFSPNSNHIAFVRNNNLFYADLQTHTETQITTDGEFNRIINGTTDWVYEEEFGFTQGFHWSPNGDKIAYLRFDESHVKEYAMTMWGELYPTEYRYKYPKAGEDNSLVTLHVYDLKTQQKSTVPLSQYSDFYIPKFGWTMDNDELFFMVLNRHQSKLDINLFNTQNQTVTAIYNETNHAYIEVPELIFTSDKFIITSEKEGYNQIYEHKKDGTFIKKLIPENYDVTAVYGLDEKSKRLYFQAAKSSSINREIGWVNVDKKTPKITLVSSEMGFNTAVFSKTYQYFINTHSSANTAPKYTLHDSNGKLLKVLEDNATLNQKFKDYNFVEKTFGTIKNAVGDEMPYWIMRPKDLEQGKKYPLLMFQYSGPGSQQVTNSDGRSADNLWYQMLVKEGYIIVCVDGRGTGNRGEAYKKSTYLQLGKYETEDQIMAAKYFASLDFIDASRIGIWGWSYGGFMSTSCLLKGNDVFKMAIAVAPVASWRYYDNIYTERYMRTPYENADGYDDNSPVNFVENLTGKYLLVHGTADDNVHFQNAIELADALNTAGKHYDFYIYPNKNHSILGSQTRLHLYQKMTNFIRENL
ncbi:MAG: S9 family peptidase [Bacteroidales bacterium]|jgi:dipeptidyl-peptidase-4|nr:S9 family peptidase [Bacteroidales bacterium]